MVCLSVCRCVRHSAAFVAHPTRQSDPNLPKLIYPTTTVSPTTMSHDLEGEDIWGDSGAAEAAVEGNNEEEKEEELEDEETRHMSISEIRQVRRNGTAFRISSGIFVGNNVLIYPLFPVSHSCFVCDVVVVVI